MNLAELIQLENEWEGQSCTVTGAPIAIGEPIWAKSRDHARAGQGICQAEYDRLSKPAKVDPKPSVKE